MMMDIDEVLLSRRPERKTPVSVIIPPLILHSQTPLQLTLILEKHTK